MWIQCWRCKGDFDASRVDTEETVGLCRHCWNHTPSEEESLDEVRKRFLDTLRAKEWVDIPYGMIVAVLEEKLMETLAKFKGQPNTSVVRDAVEDACVRVLLDMMPNKQADPPPVGLITNLVRQFMNEALDPTRPVVL